MLQNLLNLFQKKTAITAGGSTIMEHKAPTADTSYNGLSANEMEEIENHVEKYIGQFNIVWHEIISESLHLDIIHIPPSDKVPYNTLVSLGASEFPMKVPAELKDFTYTEYVMFLPKDWKMIQENWKDERWYWPIRLFKEIAKLPRMYNTWLYYGHTIPNGNPAEVFDKSTEQKGALVTFPYPVGNIDFLKMKGESKTVAFLCISPIYEGEWKIKLEKGTEFFEELADKQGVPYYVVDPERKEVFDGERSE